VIGPVAGAMAAAVIILAVVGGAGPSRALRVAGAGIGALALVLAVAPIVYLVRRGKPGAGETYLHTTRLVDSGPYGFVRHPQYLAYILFTVTFGLLAQRVPVTVLAVAASAFLYLSAVLEEGECLEKFGDAYRDYTTRVPRFNLVLGVLRRLGIVGPSRGPWRIGRLTVAVSAVLIGLPVLVILLGLLLVSIADRTNGSIVSSGERRTYLLYVPRSYDPTVATPLVISLHGAMTWPAMQRDLSGWNRLADREGFIVVYPSGTGTGVKTWYMQGSADPARMPDVQYVSALIDTLEAAYHIDRTRIYVNGMSNGGGMAFVLSCTLSDRIAAIGAVSAAQSLPWSWCADTTAVPMIAFHGTADPIVPYDGGKVAIAPRPFPSVSTWVASWAARNRCEPEAVDSAVAPDVTLVEYAGCAHDATVALYTIQGGGHQWPGGKRLPGWLVGSWSGSVDATARMWEFFREHPRSRK
jgi:polyhydroxybutyrate depolymerase